jgi:hypothetical protein
VSDLPSIWPILRGSLWNILGATLMLAGVALVALNAQSILDFNAVAAQHGGRVIDLGHAAMPEASQHGHMVRVVAVPTVVEAPRDPEFNLSVNTPVLTRQVEMFQWREVRIGDNTHYEMDWFDHWIDASRFDEPRGHANPAQFPLSSKRFDAGQVQMGGFRLSPVLQHALPGLAAVAPNLRALPANLAASFSRHGDYLQTSAHADNPQLGDIRVSWNEIPLRTITIVARVDGDHLLPAPDVADGKGYQVALGDVGLLELFPDLPTPPDAVVLKRVSGVLLAVLGALVLLTERRRLMAVATKGTSPFTPRWNDVWLALGLGVLVVGAVAATVWVGGGNRYMLWWIGLALLGAALAVWQWRRRH